MENELGKRLMDGIQNYEVYNKFYECTKEVYEKNVSDIIGSDSSQHKEMFSWCMQDLTLHFVHKESHVGKSPLIFATPYMDEKLKVYDALSKSNDFLLRIDNGSQSILSKLFSDSFFDFHSDQVINASIFYIPLEPGFDMYANTYVSKEYQQATKELKVRSVELVKFNNVRLHMDLYNFDDMLKVLNNDQFKAELLECITAYNHQYFFIAATGLGSVIEQLLSIILDRHEVRDRNFPKSPTYKDYITYMKKEPIRIDDRNKSFIDSLFLLRNSVSHHNTGFTSKSVCDHLMQGIKNIFDNYYELKS